MKKDQLDLKTGLCGFRLENAKRNRRGSADGHRGRRFPASACALGSGHLSVPERCNCGRLSKDVQDRLACDIASGRGSILRLYDLRSTYVTRLSAGGVADEWVTQLLRQGDAKVFKKYSQMKLQMKREALTKINRQANESGPSFGTVQPN